MNSNCQSSIIIHAMLSRLDLAQSLLFVSCHALARRKRIVSYVIGIEVDLIRTP
jgi:hypothetical protein